MMNEDHKINTIYVLVFIIHKQDNYGPWTFDQLLIDLEWSGTWTVSRKEQCKASEPHLTSRLNPYKGKVKYPGTIL